MGRPKTFSDGALRAAARRVFLSKGQDAPVILIARELCVSPAAIFHRVRVTVS